MISNFKCEFLPLLLHQTDAFCLRERDLLNRLAAEVSQYEARGNSKEYAFIQVRLFASYLPTYLLLFDPLTFIILSGVLELSACRRLGQSFLRKSHTAVFY